MGGKIRIFVDLDGFGLLEKPRKVIPEVGCVSYGGRSAMGHLVQSNEGDDVLANELFLYVTLSQAHVNLVTLVDSVTRILCVGSRFRKSIGSTVKIL
jgi:hypothetical protein